MVSARSAPLYGIRLARPDELEALTRIEAAAAAYFAEVGLPEVAALPTHGVQQLAADCADGRVFVVADPGDTAVGFAVVDDEPDAVHLREIDVHPAHAGRGLGARLIGAIAQWAGERNHVQLTLTTYRDVPFNAPYYARLGFRLLDGDALGPRLDRLRATERASAVEVAPRVAMALRLSG